MRAVGQRLNSKLTETLTKDVLYEGGRRLGILQRGTLVFNSEDETSVLMDYCLYDVRRKGRNSIEQYLIDSAPDPESDEMVCLRAMQHAIYSLFVVESVIARLGVTVRDLLSNERFLVVDMGFAASTRPGMIIASRLLFHEGFAMTGGAALPVGMLPKGNEEAVVQTLTRALRPDKAGRFDPADIIRVCLEEGRSSQVRYQEPSGKPVGRRRASEHIPSGNAGRNAPCPCGSGRKYKHCCMNRP